MLWIRCGTLVERSNKRGQGETKEKSLLAVLFVWGYLVADVLQIFVFLWSLWPWVSPPGIYPLGASLLHCFRGSLRGLRMWQKCWDIISKVRWWEALGINLALSFALSLWCLSGSDGYESDLQGVRSLGREDPLEKGMASHSSVLALGIPWPERPGELQSMGPQRVGQTWVTYTLLYPEGS